MPSPGSLRGRGGVPASSSSTAWTPTGRRAATTWSSSPPSPGRPASPSSPRGARGDRTTWSRRYTPGRGRCWPRASSTSASGASPGSRSTCEGLGSRSGERAGGDPVRRAGSRPGDSPGRDHGRRGATSGNTQRVVEVRLDCDGDALFYRVEPRGPACHTGEETCFFTTLAGGGIEPGAGVEADLGEMVSVLAATIAQRRREMPDGSYTAQLLADGTERVAQKVGEEAVEVVVAALGGERLAEEAADLVYHLLVLLEARGVGIGEVARVLRDRHG